MSPKDTATVDEVGGKGLSLLQMHSRGLPVPAFFVISTAMYRRAVNGQLCGADRELVVSAWRAMGGDAHRVAVRSSGVDEDSQHDSYAGVFDTQLDVDSEQGLIGAVEKCWSSATSSVADAYRQSRNAMASTEMAVVVQQMVAADWSGVTFTADPVSAALSVLCVNAVPGLGEALVSGSVDPEEIKLDAGSLRVISRRRPPGFAPIPDELVQAVAMQCRAAAEDQALPQDIEWAVADGQVWLLQCRPITTLAAVALSRPLEPWCEDPAADPDAADRLWTRAYADEMWTPPVSPLFYDIQNLTPMVTTYLRRHGDRQPIPPDVFKYFGAAAYLDVGLLERMIALQPRPLRTEGTLSQVPLAQRARVRALPWKWWGVVQRAWLFEVRHRPRLSISRTWRYLDRSWQPFLRAADTLEKVDLTRLSDDELDEFETRVRSASAMIGAECSVAVTYHAVDLRLLLTWLLERRKGTTSALTYSDISTGLDDSFTVAEGQSLWEIAESIRRSCSVALDRLDGMDLAEAREKAEQLGILDALIKFDRFLAAHCHRGANYKDLVYPRWGDEPNNLWALVLGQLRSDSPAPIKRSEQAAAGRRLAQQELLDGFSGPIGVIARAWVRRLLTLNERYASLRDNHRFYYDKVWWHYRRLFLARGERLVSRGLLGRADDVMFLSRSEIGSLRELQLDAEVAGERIRARRSAWITCQHHSPPKFLSAGYLPLIDAATDSHNDLVVWGIAASPGVVVGAVRVAHDVTDLDQVLDGEILVARQTDPSWSPVFPRLGGLILETGGVLAHGASLCREYGLPCVTVVDSATSRFSTGDQVELSGSQGTITILDRTQPLEVS